MFEASGVDKAKKLAVKIFQSRKQTLLNKFIKSL